MIQLYDETRDLKKLFALLMSDEEWHEYVTREDGALYRDSLNKSMTYVAYAGDELIGFVRSIEDFNYYVYVCDLLVHENHRGQEIGRKLLEHTMTCCPGLEVMVMSDVDPYYKKLGYERLGSIFSVKK